MVDHTALLIVFEVHRFARELPFLVAAGSLEHFHAAKKQALNN
jgi:hypothetical protein